LNIKRRCTKVIAITNKKKELMNWRCDCGEINLGVMKKCRKCGREFSEDMIIDHSLDEKIKIEKKEIKHAFKGI
jgi:predicted RNA-binding Zn-ribbon protein involved in translation (DUF1610 family)